MPAATPSTDDIAEIRKAVAALCARFPGAYWRALDRDRAYPTEFVRALTEGGFLGCLIPEEYGGSGLGLIAAAAILEEVQKNGGNGAACHAQMYIMGTLLRHGSAAQKAQWLPQIASGAIRLQAFGVTEPGAGTDTTAIRTTAERRGDRYVVNGQKVWTSRAEHSDLMLLLARTMPRERGGNAHCRAFRLSRRFARGARARRHHPPDPHHDEPRHDRGLLRQSRSAGGESDRRGREGVPLHPRRHECRAHPDRRRMRRRRALVHRHRGEYAKGRVVFGRPIGQNQGIQFPIARAYAASEAAALMVERAASLYERGEPCGKEANMAKLLAADASWQAADMCIQTHGGFGFAEEYDVERKFRETRLYQVAPISTNLILSYLAEHVLGLPRSY